MYLDQLEQCLIQIKQVYIPFIWNNFSQREDTLFTRNDITGLILAGGEGRRVSGKDKGLLSYKGSSLIELQIAWLAPQVKGLLISANRNIDQYKEFNNLVLQDQTRHHGSSQFNGPLNGVLEALQNCATEWLFVQPIDVPNLPDNLIDRLHKKIFTQQHDTSVNCYYLRTTQREHYLSMLIHRCCLPKLDAFLAENNRRVKDFHAMIGSISIDLNLDEDAFKNLNSIGDYR